MVVDKWSVDLFFEFLRIRIVLVLVKLFPKQKDSPEQPRLLKADPRLALAIGKDEAIVVTRLIEWQRYNAAMRKHQTHYIDEKWYTYNSIDEWVADFGGCFKPTTMGRLLRKLEKMKLVDSGRYSTRRSDVRKWYHVDEDAVFNLVNHDSTLATPSCQIGKMVVSKRHDDSSKNLTTASSQRNKTSKHHHQKNARAADVDGDDITADSGEENVVAEKTAAPRFEDKGHEASAPAAPSPSSAAPLPDHVGRLVLEKNLNPAVALRWIETTNAEECERAAEAALKARWANDPAALWCSFMQKRDYQHLPTVQEIAVDYSTDYSPADVSSAVDDYETDVDPLPYIDPERAAQWQTAFAQLEIQLDRFNFDTWLRDAHLVGFEDETFVIGVHNNYAREMLTHRLNRKVQRVFDDVVGASVQMRFEVHKPRKRHEDEEMPLFKQLAKH